MRFFALLVCALLLLRRATCSNILGIFPMPLRSHFMVFDALMTGLAKRGHNVTVYSVFPKNYVLPNYTDVSIEPCFPPDVVKLNYPSRAKILECEPLLRLRRMEGAFDLLITETFRCDFFTLFGHILKVPVILMSSTTPYPWMCTFSGMPCNPTYIPVPYDIFGNFSSDSFFSRVGNTLMYGLLQSTYWWDCEMQYDLVPEFFPKGTPSIREAARNVSLWFFNTHYSVSGARPSVPNAIEIGGITIGPVKKLPQDIQKFIDEAPRGVVYFSMGSIARFDLLPEDVRRTLVYAFAKLPQRVIVKCEPDFPFFGRTDNIMTVRWLPQRDILAHPKVKLFISHGGLNGIAEAVHEGVPILGMPFTNEQRFILKNIEKKGAGEILEYDGITEEMVSYKVTKLIENSRYKQNATKLSRSFKDRPLPPLETAIYWTEFVIREGGAPHLKTDAVQMPWYQYLFIDQILFVISVVNIIIFFRSLIYEHLLFLRPE